MRSCVATMTDLYWDRRRVDVGIEVEPGRGSDWVVADADGYGGLAALPPPPPPSTTAEIGAAIPPAPGTPQIDIDVPPDRQLNQFWYSASTLQALVALILPGGGGGDAAGFAKVAYVSAPTAFFEVLAHQAAAAAAGAGATPPAPPTAGLLLEYDRRFAADEAAAVPHAAVEFFDYTAGPGAEGDRPGSVHDGSCDLVGISSPHPSPASFRTHEWQPVPTLARTHAEPHSSKAARVATPTVDCTPRVMSRRS